MVESMNWKIAVTSLLFVLLVGCGGKENFIVLSQGKDGSVGALEIKTNKGSEVLDKPGMAVYVADSDSLPSEPTPINEEETRQIFAPALAVQPLVPESFLLYFKFNSDKLTDASQALVTKILAAVNKRHSVDISVIGHTDRTGEEDYNRTLSLKRAQAVYEILAKAGIARESMTITYHGEGNPLIPTADNVPEPRNRRVEVLVR